MFTPERPPVTDQELLHLGLSVYVFYNIFLKLLIHWSCRVELG